MPSWFERPIPTYRGCVRISTKMAHQAAHLHHAALIAGRSYCREDLPWLNASSRHLTNTCPSNGLLRKQTAPAFIARAFTAGSAKCRHQNDRGISSLGRQPALQVDTAEPRHLDIGNHAGALAHVLRLSKILSGRICVSRKTERPHEASCGYADRLVIVNDCNHWNLLQVPVLHCPWNGD